MHAVPRADRVPPAVVPAPQAGEVKQVQRAVRRPDHLIVPQRRRVALPRCPQRFVRVEEHGTRGQALRQEQTECGRERRQQRQPSRHVGPAPAGDERVEWGLMGWGGLGGWTTGTADAASQQERRSDDSTVTRAAVERHAVI